MAVIELIAVPCKLYPGLFPSERLFEVKLFNNEVHRGIAPRYFCWNSEGKVVEEYEEIDGDDGMIAAKLLDYALNAGIVAVEVPDGEVLAVAQGDLRPRPTSIKPPTHRDRAIADVPLRS